MLEVIAACNGKEGIAPGYLNNLAGTVTGANTVQIDTGGALADGKYYKNDAAVSVNIPSAVGGGNTRIDRIVLRADWAAFTVTIVRIAGTDAGSPTAPAITQTSGTTYDIKLYQALVNTSGTVTLTDERTMARPVLDRQGGSATDWDTQGTANYQWYFMKMEIGSYAMGAGTTSAAITFPVAFSAKPIVLCSPSLVDKDVAAGSITASGFTMLADDATGTYNVYWLAIGPK
jgi:hypothetical protein